MLWSMEFEDVIIMCTSGDIIFFCERVFIPEFSGGKPILWVFGHLIL